jgi:hypothetical protein
MVATSDLRMSVCDAVFASVDGNKKTVRKLLRCFDANVKVEIMDLAYLGQC